MNRSCPDVDGPGRRVAFIGSMLVLRIFPAGVSPASILSLFEIIVLVASNRRDMLEAGNLQSH